MLLNDCCSDLLDCLILPMQLAGQTRFVDAYVTARGVQVSETVEQAAMARPLAIAITRLLSQNVWNFFGGGISFADIRDLELSRIQRPRKRPGIFDSLEVDGHLI